MDVDSHNNSNALDQQSNLESQSGNTVVQNGNKVQNENKRLKIALVLLLILFLSLLVIVAIYLFKLGSKDKEERKEIQSNTSLSPTKEVAAETITPKVTDIKTKTGLTTNKLFYPKDNNIYSYDVVTKATDNWTNYEGKKEDDVNSSLVYFYDIKVIDENTLGYGRCEIVTGDFGCSIDVLDLVNKSISEKKKLGKDMNILNVGFYSEDKFSYLITTDKKWQVYLYDNGNEKVLEDMDNNLMGRGGSEEDVSEIEYSNDGKYMFQISTSTPRSVGDFNVYLYNLIDGSKQVIPDATSPDWVDNEKIVYRSRANKGDGLYLYNVNTKTKTKIKEIDKDAYKPSVNYGTGKILYTLFSPKQIWLYDLNTKENIKVKDNATYGYWISPKVMVYNRIKLCNGDETCEGVSMSDYEVLSKGIYDIEKKQDIGEVDF